MGTTASFFVGGSTRAKWVATIWRDGQPDAIPRALLAAKSGKAFAAKARALARRNNVDGLQLDEAQTLAEALDQREYVYTFERRRVVGHRGEERFDALAEHTEAKADRKRSAKDHEPPPGMSAHPTRAPRAPADKPNYLLGGAILAAAVVVGVLTIMPSPST
jgi:hypothetical protein